jgi:ribosome-binding factor A
MREIADLLHRRVKDPRLESVTVSGVDVTPDLRHAHVYYSYIDKSLAQETVGAALEKAKGFIRRELGARIELRYLPELHFHYDTSFDHGEKIDRILKSLDLNE